MRLKFLITCLTTLLLFSCGSSEPTPEEKEKTARNLEKQFIGNWRVFNDKGDSFYISIKPDGTSSNTWGAGQQGRWEIIDDKIILYWPDGWKDILFIEDNNFKKSSFAPGKSIDATPSSHASAERVDVIPAS